MIEASACICYMLDQAAGLVVSKQSILKHSKAMLSGVLLSIQLPGSTSNLLAEHF